MPKEKGLFDKFKDSAKDLNDTLTPPSNKRYWNWRQKERNAMREEQGRRGEKPKANMLQRFNDSMTPKKNKRYWEPREKQLKQEQEAWKRGAKGGQTMNKKQKPTSTTTTTPAPRLKKAEAEPSFFERAKSGLKSLMPQPGKLAYNEENFEPEKKMVGKAQRGMKSYLKGSMGKGGM